MAGLEPVTAGVAPKRIAVLFHARDQDAAGSSYIVDHLARFWREDGHEVVYVFGVQRFVPADLVFVHVNLSVVDEQYLQFAAQYPLVVNGSIRDIRKSAISSNLVHSIDDWRGPVVVKSDLNFGGLPELTLEGGWLQRRSAVWRRLRDAAAGARGRKPFRVWTDYRVYDNVSEVPRSLIGRHDLVVEKFMPEVEADLYHVHVYQFLGDRSRCTRLASSHPLFKAHMSVSADRVEPHPEVETWRRQLQIDYGKLDYVVHDGKPVLIDVNKTTGASKHMGEEALQEMRRYLAEGLYSYFG